MGDGEGRLPQILPLRGLRLIPALDYPAMLCYAVQDSDVCMTMVDGRILYENGEYLTLDAERIKATARTALRELYE